MKQKSQTITAITEKKDFKNEKYYCIYFIYVFLSIILTGNY